MPYKALFLAPSAYPLGGVAVWLDYVSNGLGRHGWEAVAGLAAGKCHDVLAYRAAYPSLSAVAIVNRTGSREGRIRAIQKVIEDLKPDIAIGVNIVDVYPAAERIRWSGRPVKVVLALHGLDSDLLADAGLHLPVLDALIATNALACRLCMKVAGMSNERVFYAPYGVDVSAFREHARVAKTDGLLRVVWVGRLEQPQKRVGDLRAIVAELDRNGVRYCLSVVGDGPERDQMLDELSPWIADGRVIYRGALPAGELGRAVYAHADVLLLTALWETGPIVIWEAMAAGVAVVTSRYIGSGLENALHHEENCLMFAVGDCAEAGRQLTRLATDAALIRGLVTAGRELVATRYSIERSVRGWADCLDEIMRLPALPSGQPTFSPPPSGRLDRVLGVGLAESIRAALGVTFQHTSAGGEWPHTSSSTSANEQAEFWAIAQSMDQI